MKRVFSIIIILGLGSTVSAQDYYTGRDRITADGITFLASVYQGVILSLANITNTRENAPEVYKDGSPIEPEFEEYAVANTIPGCVEKAFTETFTREDYELLRTDAEAVLTIGYVISPAGVTEEVSFTIRSEIKKTVPTLPHSPKQTQRTQKIRKKPKTASCGQR